MAVGVLVQGQAADELHGEERPASSACRSRRPARCWGAAPAPPAPPPAGTAAPGWGTRTRPPAPSSRRPAGAGLGAAPCTPPPCRRDRPRPGCRSPRPAWGRGESPAAAPGSGLARARASSCDRRKARTAERRWAGLTSAFFPAGSALLEPRQQTDRRWSVDRCGGNTSGQSPRWAETWASSASVSWPRDSARSVFVIRMVQRGLGHGKPAWVRRTAKRHAFPVEKRCRRKTLHDHAEVTQHEIGSVLSPHVSP